MGKSKILDCRGMECPQPVINTKNAIEGVTEELVVIVDNDGACTNVTRFAESQGALVSVSEVGGEFRLTIHPGRGGPVGPEPAVVCDISAGNKSTSRDTVVYISSETMGDGDSGLGKTLMGAFLDTLSQFGRQISRVLVVNGGAALVVRGSPVVEQLKNLEEMGVEILTCGTCLKHFGIEDDLMVGSVSNMFSIVEALTGAEKIIRP